jgi:oligopeptidase B
VPISLAYKRTIKLNGTAPIYIEAYGSYGISSDPYFSISKASLLERGWIVATAHPRGGGEMGWSWHKQAKLTTKHRTYQDVIACIDTLVKKKYGAREKTAIIGGSAGGMMVGAVLNMRPDVVGAAIAYVPAADLITSSLDESLGGTRLHYDETGDPRKPNIYKYLMRYSPYENIKHAAYPPVLVRANMNDIRTPYWEAAKWVARLRAKKDR